MKILIYILFTLAYTNGELPPSYPSRAYLTSPASATYGIPYQIYGPPKNAEPIDSSVQQPQNPAKFTTSNRFQSFIIPKEASSPEQQRILYGAPNKIKQVPQRVYNRPVFNAEVTAPPQTTYGVPQFNSKVSSLQIRQFQNQQVPQRVYGAPQFNSEVPSLQIQQLPQFNKPIFQKQQVPQKIYGVPQFNSEVPSLQLQQLPQTTYGVPHFNRPAFQGDFSVPQVPQTSYGSPQQSQVSLVNTEVPQVIYGTPQIQRPSEAVPLPSTNYGIPKSSGLDSATLEEVRQLRQLIEKIEAQREIQLREEQLQRESNGLSQQYLPVKGPNDFGKNTFLFNSADNYPQNGGNNLYPVSRKLPEANNGWNTDPKVDIQRGYVTPFGPSPNENRTLFKSDGNNGIGTDVEKNYIPPATEGTIATTTELPIDSTTLESDYDAEDTNTETPNVSIATASVGVPDDQQYYLLHPDGRYQRIIYQKSENNNRQSRYTAKYQLLPFSPLYAVYAK